MIMTPEKQQVRDLLLQMFTTSRGRNIIDSGGAYGVMSDRNKTLGLGNQPFVLKQDWEPNWRGTGKGVYLRYLVNTLKYVEAFTKAIHQPLQTAVDTQELTFSGSYDQMNDFVARQFPDQDVDVYASGYTYNMGGTCHLHSDNRYIYYIDQAFEEGYLGKKPNGFEVLTAAQKLWKDEIRNNTYDALLELAEDAKFMIELLDS